MPSRLYFSNSLEALAERLIDGLRGGDVFETPVIATPSPAMRGWLQIRIAEKTGIAANIDFMNLERLLWERLARLDHYRSAPDRQPARILDVMNFQGLVLTFLQKNPPEALRHYVQPENGEPYDEARRLCQLAGRLAALFREYEYSRVSEGGFKGLTETWNNGEACFEQYLKDSRLSPRQREQIHSMELWQREIYQALFRENGLRDNWGAASGLYRYTLPQYAEMVLNQDHCKDDPIGKTPTFHLFGLSHISPFHRALIYRLGDANLLGTNTAHFEIHALNPCAEYWEDAGSRVALTREELQGEELPEGGDENALLNRFGKPGRETIKLWNQITDYDFTPDFREPEGETVLAAVQRALLHRSGSLPEEEKLPQDSSLQIWSAPDRHAEVEAAKAHIAEALLADPLLKLEDIAIIPADFEAYLPILESIFSDGKEAGFVPFCLPEAGMLRESPLLRGFRELIELGSGPFRRGEWLAWLENPAVKKKLRLNGGIIASFEKILTDSGFQEGWDEEHQQWQDTIPGSLGTSEAALQRSLLGLIVDSSDAVLETAGLHSAASAMAWDREDFSQCLDILEKLRRDLRPFRSSEKKSFAQWGQYLRSLLENYFAPDPDQALEIQAEKDLLRFCADLEQWDASGDDADVRASLMGTRTSAISHHTIAVLLDDHFREPRAARMPFLAGGVRIANLTALRSLPFRCVYLLGFNAGDFPSSRELSPLDLRGYRRVIGEADPASRDLYAFLEILSTTSDRAILSYIRRDAKRDSVRQPSQALAGLIAYLESDLLKGKEAFAILEIDSEGRYTPHAPNGGKGGIPWQPSPRPRLETLRLKALEGLSEGEAQRLVQSRLPLPSTPRWAEFPLQEKPDLDLQSLALYLQNPLEQACFENLHLRTSLEAEAEEGPALFLNKWETQRLLEPGLRAELLRSGQGEAAALLALQRQIWSGHGPSQPYADLELEYVGSEAKALLENSFQKLHTSLDELGLIFAGTLRIGGQGTRLLEAPIVDAPAFDATPLGIPARITGMLPLFFRGRAPENGWGLMFPHEGDREKLAAYVFHLCVAALDSENHFPGPGHILFYEKGEVIPLAPPENAVETLSALLIDALKTPDFDHLPLSVIGKLAKKNETGNGFDWKRKIEEREKEDEESSFTPTGKRMRILRALNPEVPRDAGVKIERRILPYLQWWKTEEASVEKAE